MSIWVLLAAAVGLFLIVVLLIGMRRPRTIQAELDRPRRPAPAKPAPLEDAAGSLAQSSLTPVTSPLSPESVDWTALLNRMQQLADGALGSRSTKVKAMLGAAQPSRASFTWVIDRIANTSVMFVDPARLESLASQLRLLLDEATG